MADNISSDTERQHRLAQGLMLLDEGDYWEAHEAWEALWLSHPAPSAARRATKALIQLAAICYKPEQAAAGRTDADMQRGMTKLLATARRHLTTSFELPSPSPAWHRPLLGDAFGSLDVILDDWRAGQSLDVVRRRIRDVARDFRRQSTLPSNTS